MLLTQLTLRRVTESVLLPAVTTAVRTTDATPALALMADFLATAATTIDAFASLGEAECRMGECGLGLLIVLDEQLCVIGVIDKHDLRGERSNWPTDQPRCAPSTLRVIDVMTRLRELDTLDLVTIAKATPQQVMETLRCSGRDHLLVIEPSGTDVTGRLRGVVAPAPAARPAPALQPTT